jgi:hypothetical protein
VPRGRCRATVVARTDGCGIEGWAMLQATRSEAVRCNLIRSLKTSMFFLFSNRLGCFGSILVSVAVTLVILFLFGILRF